MHTFHLFAQTNVPEKERYIFLWDVSASLLTYEKGSGLSVDTFTNQNLLTRYNKANGLWMPLKEGLIKAIKSIETNDESEIIVIPFYANTLDVFKYKASIQGKDEIIKKVEQFEYVAAGDPVTGKLRTNIVSALTCFENIVEEDCLDYINYMYLYTDGAHENENGVKALDDLIKKITDYDEKANSQGRYIYRFYYLVDAQADPDGRIEKLADDSRRFWVVKGLVDINFIGLETSSINYTVCDNPGENIKKNTITIKLTKDFKSYKGGFEFSTQNDDYYIVKCTRSNDGSSIEIEITPKVGVNLPKTHNVRVKIELDGSQEYYYLLNDQIEINCITERSVSLALKNTKGDKSSEKIYLGNTSYYPPFMGKSGQFNYLNFSLFTDFDKFAIQDNASFNISFVDSEGNALEYTDFKIVVNKVKTLSATDRYYHIEAGQEQIDFTILPSETADDYNFKGYLIVSQINDIDRINGEAISNDMVRILPWEFKHERKRNPLFFWITILLPLLFIASLILYWFLWRFGAKFPKNWDINFESNINGNPTIVFDCPNNTDYRFKRKRVFTHNATIFFARRLHSFRINKVVLCNKTKCVWSYWNGYSIYIKTNLNDLNTSIKSITFTPVKGILAKVEIKYLNRTENGELNYRDCGNETNRINIKHINVDIFGKKHNN